MASFLSLASPTVLLYLFVTLAQVAQGIYAASENDPPPVYELIYALGFLWIIGWWF